MTRYLPLPLALGLMLCTGAQAQNGPRTWIEPQTGLPFVWIPKACFQMGTDEKVSLPPDTMFRHLRAAPDLAADEHPRHEVCVDGFWISKYETRNADWRRIMGPTTGTGTGAPDLPVSGVTWSQARAFAERLGATPGAAFRFRLPTEAEWEYACRGGAAEESVPTGREAVDRAWYNKNEDGAAAPRPVGKLAANGFGVHDMLGNVWEWVDDGYLADAYAQHALFDPRAGESAADRVIRGGSHRSEPMHMRCANRGLYPAGEGLPTLGFRLVRSK